MTPATGSNRSPTGPLVYFAEDDDELRHVIAEGLRRAGFEVVPASSGGEILRMLTSASRGEMRRPDVLVMDVRMPICSGLDVLGALRMSSWTQPIVLITGFGEPALHVRATERGASVVLDKPFDLQDLIGVLDLLLLFDRDEDQEEEDESEAITLRYPRLTPDAAPERS